MHNSVCRQLLDHLNTNDRGLIYGNEGGVLLHIDHIKPLSSFKTLFCRVEMLKAANVNNLRLLPGPENLSKSDTFTTTDSTAYDASKEVLAISELEKGWRAAKICDCELCVLDAGVVL